MDFIAELRQTRDLSTLPVGRRVVVIGGGMTAVDAAVQARLLGAEEVALVYRGGRGRMSASAFEQDLAAARGVRIVTNAWPLRLLADGAVREVEFVRTADRPDGFEDTGETFRLPADQVFKASGQRLDGAPGGLALAGGRIRTSGAGRTSRPGVWAGGDCVADGDDLVVTAVGRGRAAAGQRQRPALRRRAGRGPAPAGPQQHRADHRPPPGAEPARDQDRQARLPDRAVVVSLMVPCEEDARKRILRHVEETGADGVELNFGCPHGMNERGMGSAVGQVPEYVEMVTRWVKAATRMPVIVKLTPNVADVRRAARAARACPVESCIAMEPLPVGAVDTRTGQVVEPCADWTTHPHNPAARAQRGPAA